MEAYESLVISLVTLASIRMLGALLFFQWVIQKRDIKYIVIASGWFIAAAGVVWGIISLLLFNSLEEVYFSLFSGLGTFLILSGALMYFDAVKLRTIFWGSIAIILYGLLPLANITVGPSPGLLVQFLVAIVAAYVVVFKHKVFFDRSKSSYYWLVAMVFMSVGLIALFGTKIIDSNNISYGFMGTSIVQTVALIFFLHLEYNLSELKIRQSELRYRVLFENAPIALWEEDTSNLTNKIAGLKNNGITNIKDYADKNPSFIQELIKGLQVLDVNREAIQLHDAPNKQVLMINLDTTFTPHAYQTFTEIIIDIFEGKTDIKKETVLKTLKGQLLNISLRLSLLSYPDSSRSLISMTNITEDKKKVSELAEYRNHLEKLVEERTVELDGQILKLNKNQDAMLFMVEDLNRGTKELNSEREKLKKANKELEAFSFSVSHDLRAPLRGIHGFTQILMEDYADKLDDEGKRICSIIKENSQIMGKLIDDLLAFSRLSRSELQNYPVDMGSLLNSVYFEVTDEESRKRIDISIGNLDTVYCDPTMIKQVWANLLSNAIKFSSKKKKSIISITCTIDTEKYVFCISDNGAGFDMKYIDKLFGVFQRLHSPKEFEGTGVGLPIVQRIIQKHGGEAWGEGEVGTGAKFYFSLPVNSTEPKQT